MMPGGFMSSMPSITGGAGGSASGRNDGYNEWGSPFIVTSIGGGGSLNNMLLIGAVVLVAWIVFKK